jgi:hypothetical protein
MRRLSPIAGLVAVVALAGCGGGPGAGSSQTAAKTTNQVFRCLFLAGYRPAPDTSGQLDLAGQPRPGFVDGLKVPIKGQRYPVVLSLYATPAEAAGALRDVRSIVVPGGFAKTGGNVLEWSAMRVPPERLAAVERCAL